MIDLHSHILPGLDDGAPDLRTALVMASMAVRDGIRHCVCTPHIVPGIHNNTTLGISARVAGLRKALLQANIPLTLSVGAEIHLAPNLMIGLCNGSLPPLGTGRAVLLELPATAVPPQLPAFLARLLEAGYRPVIAHPERMRWIESRFAMLAAMHRQGVAMQVTAGSLLNQFGKRANYWAECMLEHGLVDVIASDAHDPVVRPPLLSAARERAAFWVGEAASFAMVDTTPAALLAPSNRTREPMFRAPAPVTATARPANRHDEAFRRQS